MLQKTDFHDHTKTCGTKRLSAETEIRDINFADNQSLSKPQFETRWTQSKTHSRKFLRQRSLDKQKALRHECI